MLMWQNSEGVEMKVRDNDKIYCNRQPEDTIKDAADHAAA